MTSGPPALPADISAGRTHSNESSQPQRRVSPPQAARQATPPLPSTYMPGFCAIMRSSWPIHTSGSHGAQHRRDQRQRATATGGRRAADRQAIVMHIPPTRAHATCPTAALMTTVEQAAAKVRQQGITGMRQGRRPVQRIGRIRRAERKTVSERGALGGAGPYPIDLSGPSGSPVGTVCVTPRMRAV